MKRERKEPETPSLFPLLCRIVFLVSFSLRCRRVLRTVHVFRSCSRSYAALERGDGCFRPALTARKEAVERALHASVGAIQAYWAFPQFTPSVAEVLRQHSRLLLSTAPGSRDLLQQSLRLMQVMSAKNSVLGYGGKSVRSPQLPLFLRSSARASRAALTSGESVARGSAVWMKAC